MMLDQKGAATYQTELSTTRRLSAPGQALFFLGRAGASLFFERKVDEGEAAHHFSV
jgi:hypothetical protein